MNQLPYIIIYEFAYDALEKRVNQAMSEGYKPHGSLVFRPGIITESNNVASYHEKGAFLQPMVLKN